MAEILGAITGATKLFLEVNQVSIDNWNFKMYYKATTSLLLACSVISSSKQFFGSPISCETVSIIINTIQPEKEGCFVKKCLFSSLLNSCQMEALFLLY